MHCCRRRVVEIAACALDHRAFARKTIRELLALEAPEMSACFVRETLAILPNIINRITKHY